MFSLLKKSVAIQVQTNDETNLVYDFIEKTGSFSQSSSPHFMYTNVP